ncbi:ricin-type beta-trefoil lectin domain protein [Streptosporangium oxazolinicum]|uniref:Ricin-type beta-trefoil lectin domain protein n=1 Tax=Streptosporangium oxazolinicum TaxID=909287 RepID=A0ABP8APS8_9ACTN
MRRPTPGTGRRHALWATAVMLGGGLSLQVVAPAQAAAPTANVWVTTADGGKLLQQQPAVTFGADSGSASTIDVSDAAAYQTMDGFGASFTDSSAWLVANRLSTGQRAALMDKLFDRGSGIGLSLLRQPMGTSDFALSNYTYDDSCCDLGGFSIDHDRSAIIPVLKQAKSRNADLKIMGTPWSPPAWMKTNNSLVGGKLRTDRYAAFADYFVKYAQAYAAEGLPIYAVTLQNEPHHEAPYASMRMEPGEQAAVVKNHLGPAFAAAGLSTKIIAWDHNWDEPNYPIEVLNDAGAKRYLAGSAFHCYAGDVGAQSAVHNAHPDRDIWFTECSGGNWATDFGANLKWNLQNLVIGATRNWAKGVTLWNMALDQNNGPTNGGCTTCRGVVTIDNNSGNVAYNVEYYVLGHVSKFVVPGARRIDSSTYAGDLESVAFKNPDGSIALLALNAGSSGKAFKVRWKGQSFTYTLPAGAAGTFTWDGGGGSGGDTSPPTAPTNLQASQTTASSTRLSWGASSDNVGVSGYVIFRNGAQVGTSATTTFTDSGLSAQTTYSYTVRARDAAGNLSPASGAHGVTTPPGGGGGGIDPTAWYQVVNVNSGKCLDAAGAGNGAVLRQWACGAAGGNQQWQLRPTTDGFYQVLSRNAPTLAWDLTGGAGATGDGVKVQLWTYGGGTNQQWKPVGTGGTYTFQARNSGKCLDVTDVSTADGARLQQWSCHNGPAQSFRLTSQP